jgi:hypothetical protein
MAAGSHCWGEVESRRSLALYEAAGPDPLTRPADCVRNIFIEAMGGPIRF